VRQICLGSGAEGMMGNDVDLVSLQNEGLAVDPGDGQNTSPRKTARSLRCQEASQSLAREFPRTGPVL
jgi:hypothetical protein